MARCDACLPSAPAEVTLRHAMRGRRAPSVASPFESVNALDTAAPRWYATRGAPLPPSPMRFVPVLPPRPPRGRASNDNVQREAPLHAAQSRAQSTATPGTQRKQRPSRPRPSTRHTQETLQVTTTPIQHGHDRLVVALDGEITPHSAQEFVVAIDQRLEQYFCQPPRGLRRLPRRLERRARAHGARVCALARRRGGRARVRHRQGNHRACNGTSAHDRPSVVRGTAANARAYDRRARPWCGCEPTPDRRSQRLRMWSRAPAPHLRRRQRRRPIGALRRPRRRSAPRSAPRCSDMVRGRRM